MNSLLLTIFAFSSLAAVWFFIVDKREQEEKKVKRQIETVMDAHIVAAAAGQPMPEMGDPKNGTVTLTDTSIRFQAPGGKVVEKALADLLAVFLTVTDSPFASAASEWGLLFDDISAMEIPSNAAGASKLQEYLSGLDGYDVEKSLAALLSIEASRVLLWKRPGKSADTESLAS